MRVNPYLHFDGKCEEAFKFYEKSLGGKIEAMMAFEGSPMASRTPAEWRKKIMHARMTVGEQVVMGSDPPPGHYNKPQGFSVCLDVKNAAEAERVFQALSENGKVTMPIQETFWAVRFGMLVDQFGIPWMIDCEKSS
jgi:PhnB protein